MDLLLWVTSGFIIIGIIFLIFKKKSMENNLAFIKANKESEESTLKARSIVWWIVGVTAWGIVSIFLIVRLFHNYYG
ncbi:MULTISPECIES: hypothetical protein [unclassified Cytobacillus]|uniref:hypothetical protein n=1 Tax=unclassified Cytobacillus TaxID=2675268 RepID=UPI00135C2D87|nr:hypothetical protein [Cytobacillus sp. AMY 15.2]KAF0821071.1 hypothetical protein KIS4809_0598 [Bacillus sp. ZZV12-4809]MCM3091023.1 hypothetical protein [Cytobacillus sp. AMY 15.2]